MLNLWVTDMRSSFSLWRTARGGALRSSSSTAAGEGVGLRVGVAELEEGGGHGLVDDLDHAAADQLLVLDQGEVGLDAGGVAIHHEADGAGGREHSDLRVAVSELLAVSERFVPALLAGFVNGGWDICLVDVVDAGAMHADDVEEGFAVDVPAGAGGTGHDSRASFGRADVGIRPYVGIGGAGSKVHAEVGFSQALLRGLGGGN